ncbi:hypothetical protein [Xanthomonas bonasiae]|uniref:hypothetical protein n=1 Tax=Xanthomonas bonasiae TaxID=2810351 RepID=UPI0019807940|nr:hypothetical protein [Xanthomonas bonasiae]
MLSTNPIPHCCKAIALTPSPMPLVATLFAIKLTATAVVNFGAKPTVKLNTDNENIIPIPYSSHF